MSSASQGAKVDSIFIALLDSPIELVLCRHEQNAAFMAQAFGQLTGTIGVCLVTSGPGVTNLVTGLATATSEGDPVLPWPSLKANTAEQALCNGLNQNKNQ
jgi:acetolactate synthase-1/2/3 large subunit